MTHVVCRADENLRARRTVKYLMGLVNVGEGGKEGEGQGELCRFTPPPPSSGLLGGGYALGFCLHCRRCRHRGGGVPGEGVGLGMWA